MVFSKDALHVTKKLNPLILIQFNIGCALAQHQSVALHLTHNVALRALLGQGPTYDIIYRDQCDKSWKCVSLPSKIDWFRIGYVRAEEMRSIVSNRTA